MNYTKPEFSENFFKEEVRCDFTVPELMKRTWAAEIKVLCAIQCLCYKYNITPYIFYGSLIGAVRHQGFIPWDDDIDLAMTREDYMKFLSVSSELGNQYFVKSMYTMDRFSQFHAVVSNSKPGKLEWDENRIEEFYGCPFIVGIDIFPLDYVPENEDAKRLQQLIYYLGYSLVMDWNKEKLPDDYEQRRQLFGDKTGIFPDPEDEEYIPILMKATDKIAAWYNSENSKKRVYYPDMVCNNTQAFFPNEMFLGREKLDFENIKVDAPLFYHDMLRGIYGDNYMTPIMSNSGHDYPFYKGQEEFFRYMGYM